MTGRSRFAAWSVAATLSAAAGLAYALLVRSFDEPSQLRVWLHLAIGVGMLGLVLSAPPWRSRRSEAIAILATALILRLALLPCASSDDIHRYLWEGKLVRSGESPYPAPAASERFANFRDEHWSAMNNKDKLTAYPPGSVLAFAAIGAIRYDPLFYKIVFVSVDLLVVAGLLALLARRRLPLRTAGYYAFNPVVLIAFAAEGHFDSLLVASVLAIILLTDRRLWLWAGCALALATQFKVIALVGAPLLLWQGRWRAATGFFGVTVALALPFWATLPQLVQGVRQFGADRNFNGAVHTLAEAFGFAPKELTIPLLIGFGLVYLARWIRWRGRDEWVSHWQWQIGALLLFAPTVHFWYIAWIAVSMTIRPSLLWIALSLSQGFYFVVWTRLAEEGIWDLNETQTALAWSPALVLALPYAIRAWQALRERFTIEPVPQRSADHSVLVAVPTLNAEHSLGNCLRSLRPQLRSNDRVIVSDGGSQDETVAMAQRLGATTISARTGRGNQIRAALRSAETRTAVIVHADAILPDDALARIRECLVANPGVVGGCLGQRFPASGFMPYRFVEILNEARTSLWGVSFGDQIQFFDRKAILDERFPAQPLMEDVELSLRLRESGEIAYLGSEASVDFGKWEGRANRRFWLVIYLVGRYGTTRFLSPLRSQKLAKRLYARYYAGERQEDGRPPRP